MQSIGMVTLKEKIKQLLILPILRQQTEIQSCIFIHQNIYKQLIKKIVEKMEAFQWEEKDNHTPFWVHMIAGSLAGLSEHLSMLPLDNVKTHCQAGSQLSLFKIIKNIYHTGGILNFYSGSSVLAMGCIPAHAIYFSIYESAKQNLNCQGQQNHYKFAIVGVASSLFHDLVMTPTQVLKQRLQLMRSQGSWFHTRDLAKSMYKNQGLISFYRSFPVNYMMNIPFGAMIIFFNQKIKYMMKIKENDSYFKYFLCAGTAGALASIPTCPFDVIKTKLNTQTCINNSCQKKSVCSPFTHKKVDYALNSKFKGDLFEPRLKMAICSQKPVQVKYRNVLDTAKSIWRQQGAIGFFSGLKMRMSIQSMSSAIAWGTYHVVKGIIDPTTNNH